MNLFRILVSRLKAKKAFTTAVEVSTSKAPTTKVEIKSQVESSLWGGVSEVCVLVDNATREQAINILMPDIAPHMSAGPLSILYFARFLCIKGYNVRILIDTNKTKENLYAILRQQSDEITSVVERFEVEPFPLQKKPTVVINSRDMTVATLFNTARAAKQIQSYCKDKRFIYFIQDDERTFFPASSLQCIVEESYHFDFYPLFSTKILKEFFVKENVGNLFNKQVIPLSQGCPANYYLPDFKTFLNRGGKKFVFYARPNAPRNCYEYAMHIILRATEMKIFSEEWELYGMGFPGHKDIQLTNSCVLHLIPNMSLNEYKRMLHTFDVGLSLMATPHPSMSPVDLALSGCLVVTNSWKNKTTATMNDICRNIICAEMSVDSILNALKKAINESCNLQKRYDNAKNAVWPRSWDEAFTAEHLEWIRRIMRS